MKYFKNFLILIALVITTLGYSQQGQYDFNTDNQLSTYFNGSNSNVSQPLTGGIGNTGSIQVTSGTNVVFTSKQGYSMGDVGSEYTFTAHFKSIWNSGYGGFGFTDNPNASYWSYAAPSTGLGVSVHGGGYIFTSNTSRDSASWTSSIWDLLNSGSPDDWYLAEMTITRISTTQFSFLLKIYSVDANGIKLRSSPDATQTWTATNSTMANATVIYSYFAFGGSRISNFDNYGVNLGDGVSYVEAGYPVVSGTATLTTGSVVMSGEVTDDRGDAVTDRGFVYSTSTSTPTINDTKISIGSGEGTFTSSLTAEEETTYYLRSFATNGEGTSYGALIEIEVPIAPVPPTNGLILHFDPSNTSSYSGSGTSVNDLSSTEADGTLTNGVGFSTKLFDFDGSNDFIDVPDGFADFTNGLSIFALVDFGTADSWERIIDFGNGAQSNNILLSRSGSSNDLVFELYNGVGTSSVRATLTNGILNSTLALYTVTLDGSNCKIYRDGTLLATVSYPHLPNNITRTNNYIGKSNWSADAYFESQMGPIGLYNRVLTADEISKINAYYYQIYIKPSVSSFSPTVAGIGQEIVITGTNFSGVTAVSIGGVAAASFTVDSNTQITATVASGASSGDVVVTKSTNVTKTGFTFADESVKAILAPSVKNFDQNVSNGSVGSFRVTGFTTEELRFSIGLDGPLGASFNIGTNTGLELEYGYSSWSNLTDISFKGTQSEINAALSSMTINTGAVGGAITINASANVYESGLYFNSPTGNFYKAVAASVSYAQAKAAAEASTYKGYQGYLVTITSQSEQDYIQANVPGNNIWIGLTDEKSEGIWYWDGGPEEGQLASNIYQNWCGNEPNDWGSGEDYVVTKWSGGNCWNDYGAPATTGAGSTSGYVIEYGDGNSFTNDDFEEFYSATVVHKILTPNGPSDITLSTTSFLDSNEIGDEIATMSTTDPTTGDTFTYSLVNGLTTNDNGSFTISGTSLLASQVFNASTKSTYVIRIKTTDSSGNTYFKDFVLTALSNGDSTPPTVVTQNIKVALDANGQASIQASQIDNGSTDDDSGIASMTLDISTFDCDDAGSVVTVTLTVTDNDGNSATGTAQVTVENNEIDTDSDGLPNNCDSDDDGDGTPDTEDAFPLDPDEDTDTDGDGVGDNEDAFPNDANESKDTDGDGIGDSTDPDIDGDGIPNASDADQDGDGTIDNGPDTDGDGINDANDPDIDGDGILNDADVDPDGDGTNDNGTDLDGDGTNDEYDTDDDNDGVLDVNDAFPLDANETVDTDGDGTGNNADTDDDNDGMLDVNDAFPLDANETVDTDGDGTGNNADTDDDGDGVLDVNDAFPLDATETVDTDGDGTGNNADTDDDNDGALDVNDAFPLDATETVDTDGDGTGNNADTDDDNDGLTDTEEAELNTNPLLVDTDNDGVIDATEVTDKTNPLNPCSLIVEHQTESVGMTYWDSLDCDNDGVPNGQEVSSTPANSGSRTSILYAFDTDGDGILNYMDADDDGDGVNTIDELLLNSSTGEYSVIDSDQDSIPNYLDSDDDNDGIDTIVETSVDTDGDGTPDYLDSDDDGDGVITALELSFSNTQNPTEFDSDGDGIPNHLDAEDNYEPTIATISVDPNTFVYLDTDGDGIPNMTDSDDDNDGFTDAVEVSCNANPLRIESQPGDYDDDGIADCIDADIDGDGVDNESDLFPLNPFESADNDNDGIGDNVDADDDNDGVIDALDAFPLDPNESADTDGDGIGNNVDNDLYNDGFDDSRLEVSGVLTPNTNGVESTWKITNINLHPLNKVAVYNTNGVEVFATENYDNSWDGTYKGTTRRVPAGSYLYKVYLYDTRETLTGWLYIAY